MLKHLQKDLMKTLLVLRRPMRGWNDVRIITDMNSDVKRLLQFAVFLRVSHNDWFSIRCSALSITVNNLFKHSTLHRQ